MPSDAANRPRAAATPSPVTSASQHAGRTARLASSPFDAMEARFVLWKAARDPADLAEAHRLLMHLRDHAPPENRETILTNVVLHREIAAAAKEAGL